MNWLDKIKWDDKGLVPVIAQENHSGDVLMFAWMNREALQKTAELKRAVYYMRFFGKMIRSYNMFMVVRCRHRFCISCSNFFATNI